MNFRSFRAYLSCTWLVWSETKIAGRLWSAMVVYRYESLCLCWISQVCVIILVAILQVEVNGD
jgi:hypothetical protein